jgi:hypothetical protein
MVIQILATIFIVLLILPNLYNSYKKNNLTPLGASIWAVFWLAGLVVIWFPHLMGIIGNALGVERSIDGLVYTSIILLLYLALRQRIRISQIEKEITMLSRKIALKDIEKKKDEK